MTPSQPMAFLGSWWLRCVAATVLFLVVHEIMRVGLGEGECRTQVDVNPHQMKS
ncbi:unnamed protein product [Ascophyllum nodosum]